MARNLPSCVNLAGKAQARHWHLLVRREVGASTISHYCLSNAPGNTPLEELARIQAQRYFIEHSFREAKTECGLADYQVRRWHCHLHGGTRGIITWHW